MIIRHMNTVGRSSDKKEPSTAATAGGSRSENDDNGSRL